MMSASSVAAPVFFLGLVFPLMVFRPPWLARDLEGGLFGAGSTADSSKGVSTDPIDASWNGLRRQTKTLPHR
jgi:hypothetical protein